MTDLITRAPPLAIGRLHLPRVRVPSLGLRATINAVSTSIMQAYCMAYVEPFKARGRSPLVFSDVDLEGRDPKW
jgi:hypothetical protein